MSEFGERFKAARERTGLTQAELAQKVGVDHTYISKVERGVYLPNRTMVVTLLEVEALGLMEPERAALLLAAGYASPEELAQMAGTQQGAHSLSLGPNRRLSGNVDIKDHGVLEEEAFFFPEDSDLEVEVFLEEVRRFIQNPRLLQEQRAKLMEEIHAFLKWLRFREQL
jgi:transcriptional regulator with XRE-family HTH domain